MNDYNVSDYGIFTDAVATSSKLNDSIQTAKKSIDECKTQLSSDAVFKGPIAEEALDGCSDVCKKANQLSQNCDTIEKYLTETGTNYKKGDKNAKEMVLSVNSSGTLGTSAAGAANFSGDNNEEKLYNYLSSQGFNDAAICGILANIERESGFDTEALGDGGTSYGICQWHEGRWDSLESYCDKNNLDASSIEGQGQYLVSELKNNYSGVYDTLMNVPNTADGAYQAAYKWTTDFEIPADAESEGASRGSNAQSNYWDKYGSK